MQYLFVEESTFPEIQIHLCKLDAFMIVFKCAQKMYSSSMITTETQHALWALTENDLFHIPNGTADLSHDQYGMA